MPRGSPENIVKYEELSGAFGVDHKYFEALKNTQLFQRPNLLEFNRIPRSWSAFKTLYMDICSLQYKKLLKRVWRMAQMIRALDAPAFRPRFESQHLRCGLQPSVTLGPSAIKLFSYLFHYQACMWCTDKHKINNYNN